MNYELIRMKQGYESTLVVMRVKYFADGRPYLVDANAPMKIQSMTEELADGIIAWSSKNPLKLRCEVDGTPVDLLTIHRPDLFESNKQALTDAIRAMIFQYDKLLVGKDES